MAVEVRMPRLTSSMMEGTIAEWLRREGETVAQGEALLMVETDKALTEVAARASGTLLRIVRPAGNTVEVDGILAYIGVSAEEPVGSEPGGVVRAPSPAAPWAESGARPSRVLASPSARRLAEERGMDLSEVVGSGPDGLVLATDVLAHLERTAVPPPAGSPYGEIVDAPLSPVQRAMSQRMLASREHVVQGTTFAEVDMAAALEVRSRVGVGVTALVARALVRALLEHPLLNSSLVEDRLRTHGYVNLGVAVATDRGLVVPVIHNAEKLDLRRLSEAIADRSERVRSGPLTPGEMADATFTLTNSGALGALAFVPIVSHPESAILGMGKVMETPVVRDGAVVARPMMHLAVSYNHRFIDGATAVSFLQRVKGLLEDPVEL